MKIVLASDHAGYAVKAAAAAFLAQCGIAHEDFGCGPGESVDYVDFGARAAEALSRGLFDRAVLVCGTGLGMALVANKFPGVRATPCWDEYTAEMSRKHNDANCLTLGGRVLPEDEALAVLRKWLDTEFEGGRHGRRMEKLRDIEKRNFKEPSS